MPESRFQYRGDLAVTPLPEVLETVYRYKVPGVVNVVRQGIQKKLYLAHGDLIFATSGDRSDSLGDHLLRRNRISQEEFDRSIEVLFMSFGTKRHGEVLVEMGVLTPAELHQIVVEQVRSIVHSVFDWEEGEVTFEVGQFKTDEEIQLSIPARQAILDGVKAVHDAKRLVSLLGPSRTLFERVSLPDGAEKDVSDIGLLPEETKLLHEVDGVKTLKELVAVGPGDPAHNAKLIYAFYALKLVARREAPVKTIKKIQWKTEGGSYA